MTASDVQFTDRLASDLAAAAARRAGLPNTPVELLRLGEHGMYRVGGRPVVARVARGPAWSSTAVLEVRLAAQLVAAGVRCTRPVDVDQPIVVDGHPVTFWAEIPGPIGRPTASQVGEILAELHHAPDPDVALPDLDPWERIDDRIAAAPLDEPTRASLADSYRRIRDQWAALHSQLGVGLIHGDAHPGNIALSADGDLLLIDLETACRGPREWDLALMATYATSLGWVSADEYRGFVAAYGYDVTTSPAFPALRAVRELRMTSWMAQLAAEPRVADEITHRIACLADPDLPRRWSRR
jgi:Ser/Thr protein kinase RdoA (MazF antagonist)